MPRSKITKPLPPPPNPSGLCMCGCGRKTSIAPVTVRTHGYLKGHPVRYIRGHGCRSGMERRFWERVQKPDGPGCWIWLGGTNEKGYGVYTGKLAHRRAWELLKGPIPDGLNVLHHCDTPGCVNAEECLWLGTIAENNADMAAKGRANGAPPVGERNASSKLTAAAVLEIRSLRAEGWTLQAIGDAYGVVPETVGMVVKRKTWKHI